MPRRGQNPIHPIPGAIQRGQPVLAINTVLNQVGSAILWLLVIAAACLGLDLLLPKSTLAFSNTYRQARGYESPVLYTDKQADIVPPTAEEITRSTGFHDAFTAVLAFSQVEVDRLPFVDMLDLAFAVQASAGITDRDVLSHQLGAYSEHVRDLCLIIAKIYVKGMASFPLTLQMRLLAVLKSEQMRIHPQDSLQREVRDQMEEYFNLIDKAVSKTIRGVRKAIAATKEPSAESAKIKELLCTAKTRLRREKANQRFLQTILFPSSGLSLTKMAASIQRTEAGIENVVHLKFKLQALMTLLEALREHVERSKGQFTRLDWDPKSEADGTALHMALKRFEDEIKKVQDVEVAEDISKDKAEPVSP